MDPPDGPGTSWTSRPTTPTSDATGKPSLKITLKKKTPHALKRLNNHATPGAKEREVGPRLTPIRNRAHPAKIRRPAIPIFPNPNIGLAEDDGKKRHFLDAGCVALDREISTLINRVRRCHDESQEHFAINNLSAATLFRLTDKAPEVANIIKRKQEQGGKVPYLPLVTVTPISNLEVKEPSRDSHLVTTSAKDNSETSVPGCAIVASFRDKENDDLDAVTWSTDPNEAAKRNAQIHRHRAHHSILHLLNIHTIQLVDFRRKDYNLFLHTLNMLAKANIRPKRIILNGTQLCKTRSEKIPINTDADQPGPVRPFLTALATLMGGENGQTEALSMKDISLLRANDTDEGLQLDFTIKGPLSVLVDTTGWAQTNSLTTINIVNYEGTTRDRAKTTLGVVLPIIHTLADFVNIKYLGVGFNNQAYKGEHSERVTQAQHNEVAAALARCFTEFLDIWLHAASFPRLRRKPVEQPIRDVNVVLHLPKLPWAIVAMAIINAFTEHLQPSNIIGGTSTTPTPERHHAWATRTATAPNNADKNKTLRARFQRITDYRILNLRLPIARNQEGAVMEKWFEMDNVKAHPAWKPDTNDIQTDKRLA